MRVLAAREWRNLIFRKPCCGKAFCCRFAAFTLSLRVFRLHSRSRSRMTSNGWRRCKMTSWKATPSVSKSLTFATTLCRWVSGNRVLAIIQLSSCILIFAHYLLCKVFRISWHWGNRRSLFLLVFRITLPISFKRDRPLAERRTWLQLTYRSMDGTRVMYPSFSQPNKPFLTLHLLVLALSQPLVMKLLTTLIAGTTLRIWSFWTR